MVCAYILPVSHLFGVKMCCGAVCCEDGLVGGWAVWGCVVWLNV